MQESVYSVQLQPPTAASFPTAVRWPIGAPASTAAGTPTVAAPCFCSTSSAASMGVDAYWPTAG